MTGKKFLCANKDCHYQSKQPIINLAIEFNGYALCKDCFKQGKRLKIDVVVYQEKK